MFHPLPATLLLLLVQPLYFIFAIPSPSPNPDSDTSAPGPAGVMPNKHMQGDHDCHGSSQCGNANSDAPGDIVRALSKWKNDTRIYNQYSSRTSKKGGNSGGVTAKFTCDGVYNLYTGDAIYEGLLMIYDGVGNCGFCGSYWLDEQCYVSVDYCAHCRDTD